MYIVCRLLQVWCSSLKQSELNCADQLALSGPRSLSTLTAPMLESKQNCARALLAAAHGLGRPAPVPRQVPEGLCALCNTIILVGQSRRQLSSGNKMWNMNTCIEFKWRYVILNHEWTFWDNKNAFRHNYSNCIWMWSMCSSRGSSTRILDNVQRPYAYSACWLSQGVV